jgi:metallo-beta-lactamase family protein
LAYIQFLGAAGTVTGSKHLINTSLDGDGKKGIQVLIDCGLFQGQKEWRERNWKDLPIPAREIDAVILTHAHLDHCGWIPRLVKQGFQGPIFATAATIDLCGIILPDSGHLQEEDAAFYNKIKKSKHDPALPLYTLDEAEACMQYFHTVRVKESKQLSPELSFRFVPAAHHQAAVHGRHRTCARPVGCTREGGSFRTERGRGRRRCGDGIHVRKPRASPHRSAS